MRCVVMTPLGPPVEPDVNSTLATVDGRTPPNARSTSAPGVASSSSENGVAPISRAPAPATTSAGVRSASSAPANSAASAT